MALSTLNGVFNFNESTDHPCRFERRAAAINFVIVRLTRALFLFESPEVGYHHDVLLQKH
jgi:hypothetical protein